MRFPRRENFTPQINLPFSCLNSLFLWQNYQDFNVINPSFSLFIGIYCFLALPLFSQASSNPFDLQGRITDDTPPATPTQQTPADAFSNPFDLVQENETTPAVKKQSPKGSPIPPKKQFLLFLTLFNLLFFSFIATLLRSYQQKVVQAFVTPNFLSQLYREREVGVVTPFIIMYGFFLFNAAFFALQVLGNPFQNPEASSLLTLAYYFAGISSFLLGKHLLLWLTGQVFPIREALARYSFTIMVYYILIGFFLTAANLFLSYGTDWLANITPVLSLTVIALILTFRQIRSFMLTIRLFTQHKFHFLLYICSVEFVPFILLIKFLQIYF